MEVIMEHNEAQKANYFKKGHKGKQHGSKDKVKGGRKLKKLIHFSEEAIKNAVHKLNEAADEGNVQAMKIIMDKTIPVATSDAVKLNDKLIALERLAKLKELDLYTEEQIKAMADQITNS
jgi:hypothetical protein